SCAIKSYPFWWIIELFQEVSTFKLYVRRNYDYTIVKFDYT
ncbi:uncharacterized protein METZ01_LOCUS270556, partial [marine metagenome]